MGAIKDAALATLPDPAEVQLWHDSERLAQVLHETQARIAVERHLLPQVRPWDELPAAVKTCRVAAVVELLERGIIAGPLPSA
ncbi:hypothetical protein [Micromonospora humida]|uniref:hypothetical protein n=1 Tax=Micromonospora humida TaxID=2809018 RepID=UPI0034321F93